MSYQGFAEDGLFVHLVDDDERLESVILHRAIGEAPMVS